MAHARRTLFSMDVRVKLVPKETQGSKYRVRGGLPKTAQRGPFNGHGKLLEQVYICSRTVSLGDVLENLKHPLGTLATRHTLAARLVLGKLQKEPSDVDHTGVFVHND